MPFTQTLKKHVSIRHLLQLWLLIMIVFVVVISMCYYAFFYTIAEKQITKSFQTLSESIEQQLNAQFDEIENTTTQLIYFSNMQDILFSKNPITYLQNISGCNQLVHYLKQSSSVISEIYIDSRYGHSYYTGTSLKLKYQSILQGILAQNPDFSGTFFTTIPPDNDAALPELVYCFSINNIQGGSGNTEKAYGIAMLDINRLVNLNSTKDDKNEIKAILYRDDVVYTSKQTPPNLLPKFSLPANSAVTYAGEDYTLLSLPMADIDLSIADLVPNSVFLEDSVFIRNIALLILFLTCTLLLLSSWFILHKLSKPINLMAADMRDIQAGVIRHVSLPNITDLRFMAENINETLNVLEEANRKQAKLTLNIYRSSLAQKQAQLNSYKNQINPHFLFNTLESMKSMARHYRAPELETMLVSLSILFRYSLSSSIVVPLKNEIRHVEHYFTVMDMRTPGRYTLRIDVSEQAMEHATLSMILQPLVENAITHGFRNKKSPCIILIQGKLTGNGAGALCLNIIDNGCGLTAEQSKAILDNANNTDAEMHNEHIGMENVFHRIKLLYGKRASFSIDSKPGAYTAVRLVIPAYPAPGDSEPAAAPNDNSPAARPYTA